MFSKGRIKGVVRPQAAQAQNENRIELRNMTFAIRLCIGNSLWFRKCKNKVMNVEINFTYVNMGLPLCLVCNLGAIRGRFRRVFDSVLFAVLFLHLKRRKAGDWRRSSPTNRSRITAQRRESPKKHHTHKAT